MAAPRKQHVILVLIFFFLLKKKSDFKGFCYFMTPALNDGEDLKQLTKPMTIFHKILGDLDKSQQIHHQKLNFRENAAKHKHRYSEFEKKLADKYRTVINQIESHRTKLFQKNHAINNKEEKYDSIPSKLQTQYYSLKTKPTKSYTEKNGSIYDQTIKQYQNEEQRILRNLDLINERIESQMEIYRREYNSLTPAEMKRFDQYILNIAKKREIYLKMLKENEAKMAVSARKIKLIQNENDKSSLVRKTPADQKPTPEIFSKLTELIHSTSSSGVSDRNGRPSNGFSDTMTDSNKADSSVSETMGPNKGASGVSNTTVSDKAYSGVFGTFVSNKGSNDVYDTNGTFSFKNSRNVSGTIRNVSNIGAYYDVSETNVSYVNVSNKGASSVVSATNKTASIKASNGISDTNVSNKDSISGFSEREVGGESNGGFSTSSRNGIESDNKILKEGNIRTKHHNSDFKEDFKSKMKSADLFGIYHNLLEELKNMTTSIHQAQNLKKVVGRKNHKIVMVKFPAIRKNETQYNKGQNIVLTKNEEFDYGGKYADNKK